MPYAEYLFCENCGNYARLDIDPEATIEAYNKEGRKSSSINPATLLWDYLIYSCDICEGKFKYTYRDVEGRVRKYFSSLSQEYKEYFDNVVERFDDKAPTEEVTAQSRIRNTYKSKD